MLCYVSKEMYARVWWAEPPNSNLGIYISHLHRYMLKSKFPYYVDVNYLNYDGPLYMVADYLDVGRMFADEDSESEERPGTDRLKSLAVEQFGRWLIWPTRVTSTREFVHLMAEEFKDRNYLSLTARLMFVHTDGTCIVGFGQPVDMYFRLQNDWRVTALELGLFTHVKDSERIYLGFQSRIRPPLNEPVVFSPWEWKGLCLQWNHGGLRHW